MIEQLSDFVDSFLVHHGLQDFDLAFAPPRRGSRRAKRGNTLIEVIRPIAGKKISPSATLAELLETKLYTISPEIGEWVSSNRYKAVLTDHDKAEIPHTKTIGDLRKHREQGFNKAMERSRKDIEKVFQECDRRLGGDEVNKLASAIVKERKGQ